MFVGNSTRRVMTHRRPQVQKLTASLPPSHHVLEDILSKPSVRRTLLWMTRRGADGKCLFERLCENYDRPQPGLPTRLKWALPSWIINLGLRIARLDKRAMKERLFHHPPTVKALTLTAKSIGTYGLTAPQRYTAPLFIVWNITQACNLTCRHCYQNATHKPQPDELTTEQKLDFLDQLAAEFVPFLAIAGGEPLVTRDLWPVLERCRARGIHVTLATNGTMLTPEMCHRLKDANVKYIEVSLDSLNPDEHDAFRGMRGAWAHTVQGIKNSVAAGVKTGLACCFTRATVHTADDMVKFAIDLGCKTFSHFNFIPVGRGREIVQLDLTPGQREILMRKLQRHLEEGKICVVSTAPQFGRSCILYGSEDGLFATGHAGRGPGKKTMVLSRYVGGCGSGRCYCSVQPNGVVTPCVYISGEEVGDLRRQRFAEIWNNPLFAVLSDREDRGDHCGVCDYRSYCGGCRARAFAYTGDMTAGDPGCLYNIHEWEELTADTENGSASRASELVSIAAAGVVTAAAQAEQVPGLREDDFRAIRGLADRLKFPRAN